MRMNQVFRRRVLLPLLVLVAVPVVVWIGLPWPWVLRWVDPSPTSFMLYRQRQAARADEAYEGVQDWVPLDEMPKALVRAVLVSEDDRFREHHGIDWKALADEVHWAGGDSFSWWSAEDRAALGQAVTYYRAHRDEIKGRSTLTQQLAKNLYYTPDRSLTRKAAEFVVARRLEFFLGKDRILELYLNTAELGPGLFGVGAASRKYFGVAVQRVSRDQAAALAATLPQPLSSNPAYKPGRMEWRRDLILARLAGRNVVIPDEPPPISVPTVEAEPGAPLADTLSAVNPDTMRPDMVLPDTVVPDSVR